VETYKCFTSKHKQLWNSLKAHGIFIHLSMWIGSAHLALARCDSFYINKARRFLREFERAVAAGNPDAGVLKKILDAQYSVLTRTPTKVRDAFECAIVACQASGFVHYEAYLSERVGIILVELGHLEMASRYISNAVLCFETWSATAKVRSTRQFLQAVTRQIGNQSAVGSMSNRQGRLSSYVLCSTIE